MDKPAPLTEEAKSAIASMHAAANKEWAEEKKRLAKTPTGTPWETHPNEPRIIYGHDVRWANTAEPTIIAYVETVNPKWEANRALLTSAPELLAALSVAQTVIDATIDGRWGNVEDLAAQIAEQIDRAIRKAKGAI